MGRSRCAQNSADVRNSGVSARNAGSILGVMVRIREILDPELRQRIVAALADRRGCSVAAIPEWFELDDADFVDLLDDLRENELPNSEMDDSRM
jgi:hypothetical protein